MGLRRRSSSVRNTSGGGLARLARLAPPASPPGQPLACASPPPEGRGTVDSAAVEKPLDLENWPRRQTFEYFRRYPQPFWNLTAEVDVTRLVARCREEGGPSFFLASYFLSLKAANETEPFRMRLRDDGVIVHPKVDGGCTVLKPDESFAFVYFDYVDDFPRFAREGAARLEAVRNGTAPLDPRDDRDDLIHYSVIPWVSFTSFAHAHRSLPGDSVPRIVLGKHHEVMERRQMPVSVEVHHALVDGLHVGRFFEQYQALLDGLDLG